MVPWKKVRKICKGKKKKEKDIGNFYFRTLVEKRWGQFFVVIVVFFSKIAHI
jgi:hypothetical protein